MELVKKYTTSRVELSKERSAAFNKMQSHLGVLFDSVKNAQECKCPLETYLNKVALPTKPTADRMKIPWKTKYMTKEEKDQVIVDRKEFEDLWSKISGFY